MKNNGPHPDRIRSITLTPLEADGIKEVMDEALPKCKEWPDYGKRLGSLVVSGSWLLLNETVDDVPRTEEDLVTPVYETDPPPENRGEPSGMGVFVDEMHSEEKIQIEGIDQSVAA